MNKDLKKRWIAALKSGDYKQGRSRLNQNNQFCCLGVLCDLLADDGLISKELSQKDSTLFLYDNDSSGLTDQVQSISGINSSLGTIQLNDQVMEILPDKDNREMLGNSYAKLAFLNDRGIPFSTIADIIEICL